MKTCSNCGKSRPLSMFKPDNRTRDRLGYRCSVCIGPDADRHHQKRNARSRVIYSRKRDLLVIARHENLASPHPTLLSYGERRALVVRQFKLKVGCGDCGYNAHPAALHFDHLPGFKKVMDIAAMAKSGVSDDLLLDEMRKCQVVCANCHAIRTTTRALRLNRGVG